MITTCIGLHVKYRYSCQILIKIEFSRQVLEKYSHIYNFTKIRPVGAKFFHADGQKDMTKLTVACRNFANAPQWYVIRSLPVLLTLVNGIRQYNACD